MYCRTRFFTLTRINQIDRASTGLVPSEMNMSKCIRGLEPSISTETVEAHTYMRYNSFLNPVNLNMSKLIAGLERSIGSSSSRKELGRRNESPRM